jgi:hypothetical protein
MDIDYSALMFLLKATSRAQVRALITASVQPNAMQLEELWNDLELTEEEVFRMFKSLKSYIQCYTRGWNIGYPEDFHPQLRELLEKLMEDMGEELKRESG